MKSPLAGGPHPPRDDVRAAPHALAHSTASSSVTALGHLKAWTQLQVTLAVPPRTQSGHNPASEAGMKPTMIEETWVGESCYRIVPATVRRKEDLYHPNLKTPLLPALEAVSLL